jgi:hypothetical protein
MRFRAYVIVAAAVLVTAVLGAVSAGAGTAWVLTTDFSTFGRIRGFDTAASWGVTGDLATIPGDAVGRWHDGRLYVVGRGSANLLQVYDPAAGFQLIREFSIGAGFNLQDIAFDKQGEAYVSCYDQAVLLRVDIENETILQTFSTAAFADADGLPETGWIRALGDRLYLTCQKLDRNNFYAPTGPGALLVFDMFTEQWVDMDETSGGVQPIVLTGPNPYTRIEVVTGGTGPRLRVGCAGFFGLSDGGLEEIDPVAGVSLGYLVTEATVGGDILAFVTTGSAVHLLVSDGSFTTSLRRWKAQTGQVAVLLTGNGYVYADLAWDGGVQLYLADRTVNQAGLRVFDVPSGTELTSGVLATGLAPAMFVWPAGNGVSPVPLPAPAGLALSAPYPNPCNPAAEMLIRGPRGARVQVGVFDLRGRRVRSGPLVLDSGGKAVFRFDGRDQNGRHLAAGVYRVVVQGQGAPAGRSLTLLK